MRVIDWTAAATPAGFLAIVAVFGYKMISDPGPSSGLAPIVFALAIIGLADLAIKLRGARFDPDAGTVSLPGWLSASVNLAEIRDANCDMQSRLSIWTLVAMLMMRTAESRFYAVNLSGEFGSHVALFASKRGRDHFLSGLRQYAPQCRITRYY